jgi:hypothetical protein
MNSSRPTLSPRPQPIAMKACYARPTDIVAWALASSPACGRRRLSRSRSAQRGGSRSEAGHCTPGTSGGADSDGPLTNKAGGGLHSEHPSDMGDSLGKERRAGSHR